VSGELKKPDEKKYLPFWPHYLLSEVIAWYFMLAVLIVLASLFPAGLEDKADPFKTPPHVKPEWYFLSLYQVLKLVPRVVGVTLPVISIVLLFLIPFLDRRPVRQPRRRPLAMLVTALVVLAIVALTIWGQIS